ncbi:MAG: M56 family metallopeptidase, partial [Chloroflexota bacterium]
MNQGNLPHRLYLAGFALSVLCFTLVGLCGWLVDWLGASLLRSVFLCCPLLIPYANVAGMGSGFSLLPIMGRGLLTVGLWTLIWRAWQTARRTSQLLGLVPVELPPHIVPLLVELGLEAHVTAIQTAAPVAFCFGFWRPRICLSTGLVELLSPAQLRAALLHEDYHRRRFDPLRILLAEAAGAMFFFLPAIREWRSVFKVRLELAADRYAVHQIGKSALAGALHRLLTHSSEPGSIPGTVTVGLSANAARIAALLDERSRPPRGSPQALLHSTAVVVL